MSTVKMPPKLPLWFALKNIRKNAQNPIPFFTNGIKMMGNIFTTYLGTRRIIITNNPDYIQYVVQKNNKNYHKSPVVKEILGAELGYGLLTSDGDYWLKQRRLIQPGFYKQRLAELTGIMTDEIALYINELAEQIKQNPQTEISKEMMGAAFRIVNKTLFSTGIDKEQMKRVDFIISNLQKYVVTQARQPYMVPWLKISGKVKYYKTLREEADSIIYDIINKRRNSGTNYNDLLDMLLNARYEDTGEGMTNQQLRDEAIILVVAGHETTANAMSWALYLLSQHPDVEQKVLKEANAVLGNHAAFTYDDLAKLNYTRQVIQEAMRLYPPAWVIDRMALEDDEVGGYLIPKGSIMLMYIYGTHRSPMFWKDPDTFNPDRFAKENLKDLPNYAYFPFGGGPRLCIGNNFALMEMQILLAMLVKRFTFTLVPNQTIEPQPLVTLRPKYGIKMLLKERRSATVG
ncbi:MAG TPA: cytochrome P450 [Chitinophagales bacterium]|nr:cytochrome P450 [Chitinophagales bacterium]HRK25852.1 cytochrome P450 [Chitinophagales bacterium]